MLAKIVIYDNDDIVFYNEKEEFHRSDGGPAISYGDGGNFQWYVNGHRHRLDGPAVIWLSGGKYWFIKGINYKEKQFNKIVGKLC